MYFFIYIKMSKYLSGKYYQENKGRRQREKKLLRDIKIFWKKKRKKWYSNCERYKKLSEDEKKLV